MLEIALAVLAGAFIGHFIAHMILWAQMRGLLRELADGDGEVTEMKVVRVPILKHEQVEDTILFYDADDQFICQGKSLEEAAARAAARGITLAVFEWQDTRKWFINGEVLDKNDVVKS